MIPLFVMLSDEPETRDMWWVELRTEIRSHMRAMGCHAVLGYSEQTSIRDELIILSAVGTAAVVDMACTLGGPPMLRQRQLSGTVQQPSALTDRCVDDDVALHHHRLHQHHHNLHVDIALANEVAFNGPHVEPTRSLVLTVWCIDMAHTPGLEFTAVESFFSKISIHSVLLVLINHFPANSFIVCIIAC